MLGLQHVLVAGLPMTYWVVVTESTDLAPLGTRRVIDQVQLADGRISWFVEGATFMSVLAGLVRGVVSVRRVHRRVEERAAVNEW